MLHHMCRCPCLTLCSSTAHIPEHIRRVILPLPLPPVLPATSHLAPAPLTRSLCRLLRHVPSVPFEPAHGWMSFDGMRPHIDTHLTGQLEVAFLSTGLQE